MSEAAYDDLLAHIERQNPGEPLLSTLRAGHSRVNEIYIGVAAKRLPTVIEEEDVPEIVEKPVFQDDTLRNLWSERTRLFGLMNRQSNQFHTCQTDTERAENSAKVLAWWADIVSVKAKIAYYEQHGEMPVDAEEGEQLPGNAVQLSKRLASLRSRISQKKAQLREIAGLDEGTPGKQSKIDAAEADLRRLKHLEGLALQMLKSHEQT